MQEVVQQDDDAAMTRVLEAYAKAAKTDGRLRRALQELDAVRSAKRAEEAHRQQINALRHHHSQFRESGRRAQRTWGAQSWAERERAVASSLLN